MKRNRKTIIAALLLVLYAFVATPVSLWHNHCCAHEMNNSEQHSQLLKESHPASDPDCKICAHHYAVAANDSVAPYLSPLAFLHIIGEFYIQKKITNPGYNQSNKGPPIVA